MTTIPEPKPVEKYIKTLLRYLNPKGDFNQTEIEEMIEFDKRLNDVSQDLTVNLFLLRMSLQLSKV